MSTKGRQSDDAINNASGDPNMSGTHDTNNIHPWVAGKLEGWKENDSYREYFENCKSAGGMLDCPEDPDNDRDYDDNGGYPTGAYYKAPRNKP